MNRSIFKLLLVALYLLFALQLGASTLTQADRSLNSGNKERILGAYDIYKSTYLKAVVSGDKKIQKRALEGIIKSGKKLRIDISRYENRLQLLSPSTKKSKRSYTKEKRLLDAYVDDDTITLEFSKRLRSNDINYFKLKRSGSKGYRHVFDIHAVLIQKLPLSHATFKRIRISQYKPSTIRVVLESSKEIKIRFSRSKDKLKIHIGGSRSTKTYKSINQQEAKIIVIDAGHGGKDGGAVGNKIVEKKIVLQIAQRLQKILKDRGHTVYMTRTKDSFLRLSSRTKYANKKNADLFISIHANAMPAKSAASTHGVETYFLSQSRSARAERVAAKENSAYMQEMSRYGKDSFLNALNSEKIIASHKLSIDIQSNMLKSLRSRYKDVRDGGVKEGPFWILVGAQMPAVLIEVGFLTHKKEAKRLATSIYQKQLASGIANGIERYFFNNP